MVSGQNETESCLLDICRPIIHFYQKLKSIYCAITQSQSLTNVKAKQLNSPHFSSKNRIQLVKRVRTI